MCAPVDEDLSRLGPAPDAPASFAVQEHLQGEPGGAVSWALLPSPLASIGRWLPPGASVNAQHTAIYFRDHQHAFPFLVLGGWALTAVVVFWFLRHRASGGRDDRAVRAPA